MKRTIIHLLLLSFLFAFSTVEAGAQLWKMRRFEITGGLGPSFFFGDIGGFSRGKNILGFKDLSFLQTRYSMSFSAKYRILEDINLRFSFSAAKLRATDQRGSNESRDMEAKTFIIEPALIGEFYFIKNKTENSYLFSRGQAGFSRLINSLDVYAFTGFGGVSYLCETQMKILAAMGLETRGFTAVIPVGAGANLIYLTGF